MSRKAETEQTALEIVLLVIRLLMAAALYAFVGWAFWLIWKDLRQQARQMDAPDLPALSLLRTDGAQQDSIPFHPGRGDAGAGTRLRLPPAG